MSALLDNGLEIPHFTTISSGKSPNLLHRMYTATEKRSILPSASSLRWTSSHHRLRPLRQRSRRRARLNLAALDNIVAARAKLSAPSTNSPWGATISISRAWRIYQRPHGPEHLGRFCRKRHRCANCR